MFFTLMKMQKNNFQIHCIWVQKSWDSKNDYGVFGNV